MRGGLQMNASGMAWLLMRALSLPAELVDRLLARLGGRLPQQEDELQELMGRIRRQGHLYETRPTGRQGATGDPGAYFFPVFEGPNQGDPERSAYGTSYPSYGSSDRPCGSGEADVGAQAGLQAMMGSYNSSNNPPGESSSQCMQCGVYHEDEDLSSATSTDEGEMDTEAQAFAAVTVDGEHRSDQASIAAELYHLYRTVSSSEAPMA